MHRRHEMTAAALPQKRQADGDDEEASRPSRSVMTNACNIGGGRVRVRPETPGNACRQNEIKSQIGSVLDRRASGQEDKSLAAARRATLP